MSSSLMSNLSRYMQTLTTIAAERNSTIVFPFPMEIMGALMNKGNQGSQL